MNSKVISDSFQTLKHSTFTRRLSPPSMPPTYYEIMHSTDATEHNRSFNTGGLKTWRRITTNIYPKQFRREKLMGDYSRFNFPTGRTINPTYVL